MSGEFYDALVIGAGPAGCSAASWLAQAGCRVAVVDRAEEPCAGLAPLEFPQDWVLGFPGMPLRAVGAQLAAHARSVAGADWLMGCWPTSLRTDGAMSWRVELSDGRSLAGRSLLLATGVRPVHPPAYFGESTPPLDAVSLTMRRDALPPGPVLLLGGGDNALENASYLAARGYHVVLWARDEWRGQPSLQEALDRYPSIDKRQNTPLPATLRPLPDGGFVAESDLFGSEPFATAAVLFGYEPEPGPWDLVNRALAAADERHTALRPGQADDASGVFVAGDAAGRWHPCVQTALADGVNEARQMLRHLSQGTMAPAALPTRPPPTSLNSQVLQLTGLRFGANLGVLAHERDGPQPIQVDAELNLGRQPALRRDADLGHVLDYRKVRQIIIDECMSEHTDLLESLLAKLCVRLMRLPGVLGVRIRVAKLEIFDDCEVAIQTEAGQW